jgi:hypothetical protein
MRAVRFLLPGPKAATPYRRFRAQGRRRPQALAPVMVPPRQYAGRAFNRGSAWVPIRPERLDIPLYDLWGAALGSRGRQSTERPCYHLMVGRLPTLRRFGCIAEAIREPRSRAGSAEERGSHGSAERRHVSPRRLVGANTPPVRGLTGRSREGMGPRIPAG